LNTTEIYVVSRTPQNHQLDYADIDSVSDEIDMIINTTPLGMPPYQNQSPIEESIKFNNLEIVLDIGYNNKESKFMKQFKNVEVANGLGMLIAQGIESFNLWTKSKLSFTDLYKEIKELLEEEIHD
jgi:shikimate dehydrogenase